LDGTDVDVDATNDISLDAGAASNFTTSAGALTLEGAGGVTVTSTGGGLNLNGTGQTVDLDASTLDIDGSTAITIDAPILAINASTSTTFTGDVKGPKATGDDEFTTYWQLDSLANTAPYNETYKTWADPGVSLQTIARTGADTRLTLGGAPSYQIENSDPVINPVDPGNPPISIFSAGGPPASTSGGGWYFNLDQTGIYEAMLTIEFAPNASDAMVLVELKNYDPTLSGFGANPRVIASTTGLVSPSTFTDALGNPVVVNTHLNLAMTFATTSADEDLYVDITAFGDDVDVMSFALSVSRVGAE
jgi:hypothetical protein